MSKQKPSSFTPYFTTADADQIRAVVAAVGHEEGITSNTEFIERAVMKEVRRLQRKYNTGKAWPPLAAGTSRPGRRTREERTLHERGL